MAAVEVERRARRHSAQDATSHRSQLKGLPK